MSDPRRQIVDADAAQLAASLMDRGEIEAHRYDQANVLHLTLRQLQVILSEWRALEIPEGVSRGYGERWLILRLAEKLADEYPHLSRERLLLALEGQ